MSENTVKQPLRLDLNKAAKGLRLSLDKAGVGPDIKAELIFDIDVSGSFEHEHEEGTTSQLIERLVPYGMVLDPDGAMDVFTFSNDEHSVYHVGTVTPADAEGYVVRNVVDNVPGWKGGTHYSYVLERNLRHFGWLEAEGPGLLAAISRFFGAAEPARREQKKSIIIFITDGENHEEDEARTDAVLSASEGRGDDVYFLFIGVCEHGAEFKFLKRIAKRYQNTGVVLVRDMDSFVVQSDEQLSRELLTPELIAWLKK